MPVDAPDPGPDGLTREDRLLVELRDWLYDGSWEAMAADLAARLAGRPFLFELAADLPDEPSRSARIAEDLKRIGRLSAMERRLRMNLADHIGPSE